MRQLRYVFHVAMDAFYDFLADDGWAIASHIALSTLMAMFPFLIVLTSLAGILFGSKELADQAVALLLQTWPSEIADPLGREIHKVLTTARGDILTVGAVLSVYFASNGVEALRVGLNRAYSVAEQRRWYWLRLESIGYTLIAAFTTLAMGFLIVLGPLIIGATRNHIPMIVDNEQLLNVLRYCITAVALTIALFILHAHLPAGRRSFYQILPGIVFTLVASLVSGVVFGQYLARFANNYVTMYAGLASVIIALVFMYFISAIFIYGGELNAAIIKSQLPRGVSLQAAQSLKPGERQA